MNYYLIYEATKNSLITLPLGIVCLLECLMFAYMIINWRHNNTGGKIGMSIAVLIFMLIIICILISHMSSISIYNDYLDGDYIIVEGTISNYEIGTGERGAYPDRFTVQGVDFIISDNNSTGYGYSLRHSNGGLLENGKKCKIYYIPYKGENVIMKLYLYNE